MRLHATLAPKIPLSGALALMLALAACGGGGVSVPDGVTVGGGTTGGGTTGGGTTGGGGTSTCNDVSGAVASDVRFSATDKGPGVLLGTTGMTACFTAATASAVRSTTAISPGGYYYFEGTRGAGVHIGLATDAAPLTANSGTEIATTDQSLLVRDSGVDINSLGDPANAFTMRVPLAETRFGLVVDYRGTYPVVYVLGSTGRAAGESVAQDYCAAAPGRAVDDSTPCVYGKVVMPNVTRPLFIYGVGTQGTQLSINGGLNLASRGYFYAPLAVRQALRQRWFHADRELNAKWPHPGVTGLPSLASSSPRAAVVKTDDTTPYTAAFTVTAADATGAALTGSAVQWLNDSGALITMGSTSLSLTDPSLRTLIGGVDNGVHRIQAVVTDPTTRQVNTLDFSITFTSTDSDDDGDGLTYSQEKVAGGPGFPTDPANADTDGDGLGDSVEAGYGYNPTRANTSGSGDNDGRKLAALAGVANAGALAQRVELRKETGLGSGFDTSRGIVLDDSRLAIALTSLVNPDCLAGRLPSAAFDPQPIGSTSCGKRAIRASEGIPLGQFRYFETHRLIPNSGTAPNILGPNLGQGFITATGKIDPFCCLATVANTRDPRTPVSFQLNNQASIYDTLLGVSNYDTLNTYYIGFVVDYRTSPPSAYSITTNASNGAVIDGPFSIAGFQGAAFPMLYGNPMLDNGLAMEINFGLTPFHYSSATVRSLLLTKGVSSNDANNAFVPGVGIHRRP